ncbi:hypothetical protein BH11ARM2_BH11ARM2_35490 [soil metagenome]
MRFGRGAWIALVLVTVGAIGWIEGVMWSIRSGGRMTMAILVLAPFALTYTALIVAAVFIRRRTREELDEATIALGFQGSWIFSDQGRLRREGGLLVFEGKKSRFAIGRDAFLGKPTLAFTKGGVRLADAPKGTVLRIIRQGKLVREWARADSEPTRERMPLLMSPDSPLPPRRFWGIALFVLGCAVAGGIIGGYLDFRGYSPQGRPMAGTVAIGMGGMMGILGLMDPLSVGAVRYARNVAREAGFREVEPVSSS